MKQLWSPQELDDYWLLSDDEIDFCANVHSASTLAVAPLTQGRLDARSALTIQGPGVNQLTIDADYLSRHFAVLDGNPATELPVTIADISGAGALVRG